MLRFQIVPDDWREIEREADLCDRTADRLLRTVRALRRDGLPPQGGAGKAKPKRNVRYE